MGLLDSFTDPTTMGLLSAGAALADASGPSRMPVSLAQVLGKGVTGGMAGYRQGIADQMQIMQMQQQMRRNAMINNLLGQYTNNGTQGQPPAPQSQPSSEPVSPQAAYSLNYLAGGNAGNEPGQNNDAGMQAASQWLTDQRNAAPQQAQQPPVTPPTQQGGIFGLPRDVALPALLSNDPFGELAKASTSYNAPTDYVKTLKATGIDPAGAIGRQLLQDNLYKQNYIANESMRPGGYMRDPRTGEITQLPTVPEGYTAVRGQDGQFHIVPIAGGTEAIRGSEGAKGLGRADADLTQVYDPISGQMVYQTKGNAIAAANGQPPSSGGAQPAPLRNNNPGALMPGGKLAQYATPEQGLAAMDQNLARYGQQGVSTLAGIIGKWAPPNENNTKAYIADVSNRLGLSPNQKIDLSNPNVRHAIATGIMLHESGPGAVFGAGQPGQTQAAPPAQISKPMAAAAPLGAPQGQVNAQNELSQKWQGLVSQNSQAQVTNSYLQSIKALAPQAATGRFTDKVQYVNALLAPFGKSAMDATTANDLLTKYGNQIVARLGQGGLSTDAARSILQSAYPNAHMTKDAIMEAADNLTAANQMLQAKTRYLAAPANARQPAQYSQREMAFDQYADPRLWQLNNLPATARGAFMQKQPDADQLYQKFQVARQNGWIQ